MRADARAGVGVHGDDLGRRDHLEAATCRRARPGGPTSTTGTPSSSRAWTAPATISPGALSPPIASTATGSIVGSATASADRGGRELVSRRRWPGGRGTSRSCRTRRGAAWPTPQRGQRLRTGTSSVHAEARRLRLFDFGGLLLRDGHDDGSCGAERMPGAVTGRRCAAPRASVATASAGPRAKPRRAQWSLVSPIGAGRARPSADRGAASSALRGIVGGRLVRADTAGNSSGAGPGQSSSTAAPAAARAARCRGPSGRGRCSSPASGQVSPSTGSRLEHLADLGADRRPRLGEAAPALPHPRHRDRRRSTTMPLGDRLEHAVERHSAPSGTARCGDAPGRSATMVRCDLAAVPGRRRSSVTCSISLASRPWRQHAVGPGALDATGPGRRSRVARRLARARLRLAAAVGGLELLAAGGDQLERALEHDLEAGQLLVAEVLALVPHAAGLGLGGLEDPAGPVLGRLHDLGALHHPLGPGAGRLEDLVAVAAHLGEVLLALLAAASGPRAARRAGCSIARRAARAPPPC